MPADERLNAQRGAGGSAEAAGTATPPVPKVGSGVSAAVRRTTARPLPDRPATSTEPSAPTSMASTRFNAAEAGRGVAGPSTPVADTVRTPTVAPSR